MRAMLLTALLVLAAAPVPTPIDAGPLKAVVHVSETAQLFHIVDQLSNWTPYAHEQYRDSLFRADAGTLTGDDEALLAKHAELRKRLQYGALEELFYTSDSLDAALARAAKHPELTPADVEVERKVLQHFRPRLQPFLARQQSALLDFAKRLRAAAPKLEAFATKAARFLDVKSVGFPIYVIASPGKEPGGGGYNGGVLTLEIAEGQAPLDVVLHEAWHALANPHQEKLMAAARTTEGLDFETLSEGLAYAVSPGIWRFEGVKGDPLVRQVRRDLHGKKSFLDGPYVRFNQLGLALRSTLSRALNEGARLDSYLPIAIAVFQGLQAIAEATERTERGYFCFGSACTGLEPLFTGRDFDVWMRRLEGEALERLNPKIRPQDVIVLLVTSEELAKAPAEVVAFAGAEWGTVAEKARKQQKGEAKLTGTRGPVLVFWAKDEAGLVELASKSTQLFE